jgi:hypothetical protein
MKTRTDLLNHLAEKYNLQRYLEIGVQVPELNFDRIKCKSKIGVDPALADDRIRKIYSMTSDQFFKFYYDMRWLESEQWLGWSPDLIFIDGLHTAEQVKKDFENALKILSPNGFIVLHDCNPLQEEHTIVPRPTARGHWNGDVWRFSVALKGYDELCRHTVDIDNGCMVIRNTGKEWMGTSFGISEVKWDYFNEHRKELINLITWDEFIAIGPHF